MSVSTIKVQLLVVMKVELDETIIITIIIFVIIVFLFFLVLVIFPATFDCWFFTED